MAAPLARPESAGFQDLEGRQAVPVSEADLEQEARHLRHAQSIAQVGSWRYEIAADKLFVSDAMLELHGLDRADFAGMDTLEARVLESDRKILRRATHRLVTEGRPMRIRYRISPSDGVIRWVDSRGVMEYDATGVVSHVAGTMADVTELVEAELDATKAHAEERRANDFQQAIITATPDAIHIYDVDSQALTRANRFPHPLLGFTETEILVMSGDAPAGVVPEEDERRLAEAFAEVQRVLDGEIRQVHHRVIHRDGEVRWLSRRMTPFARSDEGAVTRVLIVTRDVTDVLELEQQLQHAAMHDDLTGLPNRRVMRDRLDDALQRSDRGSRRALLLCDLDGFKRVNDRYGHQAGDELLAVVGQRLLRCCRVEDTVARMGGDEFAILLDVPRREVPEAFAQAVADRVITAISQPMQLSGYEHRISMSVGIQLIDSTLGAGGRRLTAEHLLGDADAAMYHQKSRGGNGHVVFDNTHRPDRTRRDNIEAHIRRALDHDGVEVFYQRIVDPRANRTHGVEALLRIRDDQGALLPTPDVIEVAESIGLMTALDARVLEVACHQGAAWRRDPDLAHLMLKINRSVQDITKPGFADRILRALVDSKLDAAALTLEITETVLLDATDAHLEDLRALNQRGIGLAIDDFGTGYASLRYLAELPITCIKIDRSFTARLPHDQTSSTLVRATVGLAEQLAINCIVEGVETTEQLESLPPYERLLIQGFLYGRPQSCSEQPGLLKTLPVQRASSPTAPLDEVVGRGLRPTGL